MKSCVRYPINMPSFLKRKEGEDGKGMSRLELKGNREIDVAKVDIIELYYVGILDCCEFIKLLKKHERFEIVHEEDCEFMELERAEKLFDRDSGKPNVQTFLEEFKERIDIIPEDIRKPLSESADEAIKQIGEPKGEIAAAALANLWDHVGPIIAWVVLIVSIAVFAKSVQTIFEELLKLPEEPVPYTKAMEMKDKFFYAVMGVNVGAQMMDLSARAVSKGRVHGIARLLTNVIWATGMPWMAWVISGAYLRAWIATPIDREVRRRTRLTDLPRTAFEEAVRTQKIGIDKFKDYMYHLGFPDDQIEILEWTLWREFTITDLNRLREAGLITDDFYKERLRRLGLRKEDAELLATYWLTREATRERITLRSLAVRMFREGLRDEVWLREKLKSIGYDDDTISLIVELEKAKMREEPRRTTLGQLRRMFRFDVISEEDFKRYLRDLRYPDAAIELIVETEKAAKVPRPRVVSASELRRAFRSDIIDEEALFRRLVEIGYTDGDARLIVSIEKRAKERRPVPLTRSTLERAFVYQVIDEETFRAKLEEIGIAKEDIDLLVEMAKERLMAATEIPTVVRRLPMGTVGRAFSLGIIDEAEAWDRFLEMGFPERDVEILIELYRPKGS